MLEKQKYTPGSHWKQTMSWDVVKKRAVLTVKYAFHVNVEHVVPSLLFREVEEGASPCDAGVVDENVEFALAIAELLDKRITASSGL